MPPGSDVGAMRGRKGTANGPFLRFEAKAGPQPLFGRRCVGYSLASPSGGFLCRWARMLNRCLSGTQLVARAVASIVRVLHRRVR